MSGKYQITETAPFVQFSSVEITDGYNPLFDIEKTSEETLTTYCQTLFTKAISINNSKIPEFINHHCRLVKDAMQWLNKFEKLISLNESIFHENNKDTKLTKFQICIENKRNELKSAEVRLSPNRPNKRQINAEDEERYFSFWELKKQVDKIESLPEKIYFINKEKFEYQRANIEFLNTKLPKFDEECDKLIFEIQTMERLKVEMEQSVKNKTVSSGELQKIRIFGPANILTNAFKQMMFDLKPEGHPFIQLKIKTMAEFICNNFEDSEGNPFSLDTIKTYLSPTRNDKDPNKENTVKF